LSTKIKGANTEQTRGSGHFKPRPMPQSTVLPPGEINGMIVEPLSVYSKCFMTLFL